MSLPLTTTDKSLLLSALGTPETRDRVVSLLDLAGTGNVTGPISASDNALVRFDGSTGALVKNSIASLSNEGILTLGGITFSLGPTITSSATDIALNGNVRIGSPGGAQLYYNVPLPETPVLGFAGISAIELGVGITPVHLWANGAGTDCDIGANNGHAFRYGYFRTSVQTQRVNFQDAGETLNTGSAIFESGNELVIAPVSHIRLFNPGGPQLIYDPLYNEIKYQADAWMWGIGGTSVQMLWGGTGGTIGRLDDHRPGSCFLETHLTIGTHGAGVSSNVGAIRLENGNTGRIGWRNASNTLDYFFGLNSSNELESTASLRVIGQLIGKGTTTNDNPAAGDIGQVISSFVALGDAISFTNADNYNNITSISLTAGDWLVGGAVSTTIGSAVTPLDSYAAISINSGTSAGDQINGDNQFVNGPPDANNDRTTTIPSRRYSLAATTTIYLKGRCNRSSGTPAGYGRITAVRIR